MCIWFSVCRCSVGRVEIDWLRKLVLTFQSQISKFGERMASLSNAHRTDKTSSLGNMNTPRHVFKKKLLSHTLVYFLGFKNWFYTGLNQSCHVKLTMVWWHFHGTPADASVIAPEQTVILAGYWSHTAVLFNPVWGKSLEGKLVAKMDVLTESACFWLMTRRLSFVIITQLNDFSLG